MHKCTARAAGGTMNLLNCGPATVCSRSRNDDDISGPILFLVCCGSRYMSQFLQYAPFAAILSRTPFAVRWGLPAKCVTVPRAPAQRRSLYASKFKTVTLGNEPIRGNP